MTLQSVLGIHILAKKSKPKKAKRKKLKLVTRTISVKGVSTRTDDIPSDVSDWEGISGDDDSSYELPITRSRKPPKVVIGNGSPLSRFGKPTEVVFDDSGTDTDTDSRDSLTSRLRKRSLITAANTRVQSDKEQAGDSIENIVVEEMSFSDVQDNLSTHTDKVSVIVEENNSNQAQHSIHDKSQNIIRGKDLTMLALKESNLKSKKKNEQSNELKVQGTYNTRRATQIKKKENVKRAIENGPPSRRTRSKNFI